MSKGVKNDKGGEDHYFSATPNVANKPKVIDFTLAGKKYAFETDSGVFSSSRIDPGSKVLLSSVVEWLTEVLKNSASNKVVNIVDFGCGYGPIAIIVKSIFGAKVNVSGVEINKRALGLCKKNAKLNQVDVSFFDVIDDDLTDILKDVDIIISNPPVKIGKKPLSGVMNPWLAAACIGALMVMSKNLGGDSFIKWCNETGFPAKKLSSKKGYRIISVLK